MKKIYFIIMAVCLFTLGIMAQPVITYSGNAPVTGDVYHFSGANGNFDPGQAGGGQSWDFSTVSPTIFTVETAVTPASTPFAGDFPESDIAFHITGDNEAYSFAEVSTSEMLNDGVALDPGGDNETIIHYTDAVKIMQYPFAFNDNYTDSYFSAYTMGDLLTHEWGTITVTADAWGSMITPAGIFSNTLRVKKERTYTDSVWMTGIFLYANTYSQTDYEWFTATSHTPVIGISVTGDGTSVSYRTDAVGIAEESPGLSQISIFPNPATNTINVKLPKESNGNAAVSIYDLAGKRVLHSEKNGNKLFVTDISTLKPGVYILRINDSALNYTTLKFIKH